MIVSLTVEEHEANPPQEYNYLLDDTWLDVLRERQRQVTIGWSAEHDDGHSVLDWLNIIDRGLGYLQHSIDDYGEDESETRRMMIRTAALAIAALESLNRRSGYKVEPPRN